MTFIAGISNKVIFISLIFINLIQPSRSADLGKIYKFENNVEKNLSNLKTQNIFNSLLVSNIKKKNEIEIQSINNLKLTMLFMQKAMYFCHTKENIYKLIN